MKFAIETRGLSKVFDQPAGWRRLARQAGTAAVRDVSLAVERGELFGLLGPNGAGKTTLVKMLCTLILPTGGTAIVGGHPLEESGGIRQKVGLVVSDERSFYWRLSGRRNLRFFAALHGLGGRAAEERIQQVLVDVEMVSQADKRFGTYSTGMRQRLAIARSLLHQPAILMLDEPSRSLDPSATARLHELIHQLMSTRQVTVFLITHDLSEAEKLCDRLAVMHRGRIQVVGHPETLRQALKPIRRYLARIDHLPAEGEQQIRQLLPEIHLERFEGHSRLSFQASEVDGQLNTLLDILRENQVAVHSIDSQAPSLEDVFAHYTGETPG